MARAAAPRRNVFAAHDCRRSGQKLIRTAFLAPDLVEAVLEGRAPTRLTLAALTDDLPLDWNEQRRRFPGVVGGNRTSQHPESAAV